LSSFPSFSTSEMFIFTLQNDEHMKVCLKNIIKSRKHGSHDLLLIIFHPPTFLQIIQVNQLIVVYISSQINLDCNVICNSIVAWEGEENVLKPKTTWCHHLNYSICAMMINFESCVMHVRDFLIFWSHWDALINYLIIFSICFEKIIVKLSLR